MLRSLLVLWLIVSSFCDAQEVSNVRDAASLKKRIHDLRAFTITRVIDWSEQSITPLDWSENKAKVCHRLGQARVQLLFAASGFEVEMIHRILNFGEGKNSKEEWTALQAAYELIASIPAKSLKSLDRLSSFCGVSVEELEKRITSAETLSAEKPEEAKKILKDLIVSLKTIDKAVEEQLAKVRTD